MKTAIRLSLVGLAFLGLSLPAADFPFQLSVGACSKHTKIPAGDMRDRIPLRIWVAKTVHTSRGEAFYSDFEKLQAYRGTVIADLYEQAAEGFRGVYFDFPVSTQAEAEGLFLWLTDTFNRPKGVLQNTGYHLESFRSKGCLRASVHDYDGETLRWRDGFNDREGARRFLRVDFSEDWDGSIPWMLGWIALPDAP